MGEPSVWRMRTARGTASRDLAALEVSNDQEVIVSTLGDDAAPEVAPDIPDLLALLPALEDEIEAGERRLRECVRLLRAQRATWREIGDALQVSRQAAWERFRTS